MQSPPSDWVETTVGELFEIGSGDATTYRTGDLSGPVLVYGANGPIGSCAQANYGPGYIIGRVGSAGSVTRVTASVWASDNTLTAMPRTDRCDWSFGGHLLAFLDLTQLATKSAQPLVTQTKLGELRALVPRYREEQRRIAAILDTVDEAIRQTEKLIAKLKQIKAGLLHDLLTRGLDEEGRLRDPVAHPEQFKETEFGGMPKGWDIFALSEVADLNRGKFTHRPRNDPRFYGGPYPFVQTGDIADAEGRILDSYSQTLNELGRAVSREFPSGTIAITIAANIADTAILGQPMYFPDSVVGAVVTPPNSTRYVELCIRRAKRRLDAQAPQSAQKNINLQVLRPLLIPVPDPEEQNRIADVYEAHDERIRAEEAYRDKLTKLKKGLMQDLLTGRVRVTDVALDTLEMVDSVRASTQSIASQH